MELTYLLPIFISLVHCHPKDLYQSEDRRSIFKFKKSVDKLREDISDLRDLLREKQDLLADAEVVEEMTDALPPIRQNFQKDTVDQYHNDKQEKRIVDGIKARKGGFPWQIGIYFQGKLICGGTLISMKYVMTAAHCFGEFKKDGSNLHDYEVHLGEYDRNVKDGDAEKRQMAAVKLHEDYQKDDIHANDIAMVTLESAATQSRRVFPACIPKQVDALHANDACVLTGWGREYAWGETEKILKELSTPVVSHKECQEKNEAGGWKVTTSMLCTGSKSSYAGGCMGDSGGPLSCVQGDTRKWKVYGVVSWGSVQCNGLDKYTVYTKVRAYLDWIQKNSGVTPGEHCFREDP